MVFLYQLKTFLRDQEIMKLGEQKRIEHKMVNDSF